jgi:hypothetical protein
LLHKPGELLHAVEQVAGAAEVKLAMEKTVAKTVGNKGNSIMTGLKLRKASKSELRMSNLYMKQKYAP